MCVCCACVVCVCVRAVWRGSVCVVWYVCMLCGVCVCGEPTDKYFILLVYTLQTAVVQPIHTIPAQPPSHPFLSRVQQDTNSKCSLLLTIIWLYLSGLPCVLRA